MKLFRWCVRDDQSGRLLGLVWGESIDAALADGRARHYHNVTVDDLPPRDDEIAGLARKAAERVSRENRDALSRLARS